MIPILSAEKSAITDLRNEAIELGIVTSAQAEVTGSFNDTLDQVRPGSKRTFYRRLRELNEREFRNLI